MSGRQGNWAGVQNVCPWPVGQIWLGEKLDMAWEGSLGQSRQLTAEQERGGQAGPEHWIWTQTRSSSLGRVRQIHQARA